MHDLPKSLSGQPTYTSVLLKEKVVGPIAHLQPAVLLCNITLTPFCSCSLRLDRSTLEPSQMLFEKATKMVFRLMKRHSRFKLCHFLLQVGYRKSFVGAIVPNGLTITQK